MLTLNEIISWFREIGRKEVLSANPYRPNQSTALGSWECYEMVTIETPMDGQVW